MKLPAFPAFPAFPARPRPEDRRRTEDERVPLFEGAALPGLRSEAFAEDLTEPAAIAPVPSQRPLRVWHRLGLRRVSAPGGLRLSR